MSNTNNTSKSRNSRNDQKSHGSGAEPEGAEEQRADNRLSPVAVLRQARTQLAELTGVAAESVTSFEQTDEGWALEIEVLELERVPDTMSLMASYQVELDSGGTLTGYRRVRRYERGRADSRRPGGQ